MGFIMEQKDTYQAIYEKLIADYVKALESATGQGMVKLTKAFLRLSEALLELDDSYNELIDTIKREG
jgi:hypothetical protein